MGKNRGSKRSGHMKKRSTADGSTPPSEQKSTSMSQKSTTDGSTPPSEEKSTSMSHKSTTDGSTPPSEEKSTSNRPTPETMSQRSTSHASTPPSEEEHVKLDQITEAEVSASASASQLDDSAQLSFSQLEKSTSFLEDIITTDDILSSILSSLTLKEAVRTSVLSPRWKNTWTLSPKLKFDHASVLDAHTVSLVRPHANTLTVDEKIDLLIQKTDQFVQSVDSVLQQHQESSIRHFFLQYFLHKVHSQHLDEWVRFVVALKVKALSLKLHPFSVDFLVEKRKNGIEQYDFPCQLLGSSSLLEELALSSCSLKPPSNFNGLTHLKTLYLFDVHVADDDINRLLSNCYTLENLSVLGSQRLVTLSVSHPLSQLRFLTVTNCLQLKKIDINAVNITQLHYRGLPVDIIFPHSSRLLCAKVSYMTDSPEHSLDFFLDKISSSLPHLESLNLHILGVYYKVSDLLGSSSFNCLKKLDCQWNTDSKMTLLHLATFLDAAPSLEFLQLQFMTFRFRSRQCMTSRSRLGEPPPQSLGKLRKMVPERHHANLKKVRFGQFCWDKWQIELALYLLKNAIELQSMIIKHEENREILKQVPEMEIENLRELVPPNVYFFTF